MTENFINRTGLPVTLIVIQIFKMYNTLHVCDRIYRLVVDLVLIAEV